MAKNVIDINISERISLLRYVMILGIVILHIPPNIPLAETSSGVFHFIKAFLAHAVFRSTVPVLTCISGYLLFNSKLYTSISLIFIKKTKRLIVPLFIWNFPLVLFLYVFQSQGVFSNYSVKLYPFDAVTFFNGIFSITGAPVNFPLFFLRDLFILSLLSPLIGFMLVHMPWFGLIVTFVVFFFHLDGYLLIRDTMAINFYLGGMAAVMAWDLKKFDRLALWFLAIFIIICALIVVYKFTDDRWIRLLSPFLIWPVSSVVVKSNFGNVIAGLSRYSYFIFLIHLPIISIVWVIYNRIFDRNEYYLLFWLFVPIFVIFTGQCLYAFLDRIAPKIRMIVLGEL